MAWTPAFARVTNAYVSAIWLKPPLLERFCRALEIRVESVVESVVHRASVALTLAGQDPVGAYAAFPTQLRQAMVEGDLTAPAAALQRSRKPGDSERCG